MLVAGSRLYGGEQTVADTDLGVGTEADTPIRVKFPDGGQNPIIPS